MRTNFYQHLNQRNINLSVLTIGAARIGGRGLGARIGEARIGGRGLGRRGLGGEDWGARIGEASYLSAILERRR